ncbi:cyclic nucleotide-binding protein [Elizabethkingia anophelis]|uniref:Crp/Fnr family transcriptional regulator n=1 Tax=Elizabethkingia anophelis TaxID=1117645 RepID=UPI00293C8338|nr:Crp/Fnr family transcriptional regulator [Elizabethkingia anophelis]MCT4142736.1 Crp/Fnr family transcriptional regulator [Elizabethkingia anophelis]MDV3585294.1 cyclic nucleotide-binding protein [Elizabethkingia anophelis]MDV3678544.1 cyclic nucleotide-binding protein [Elizabethkingia anophelis]MDV3710313.1 cyclic nucleotide-binding protein [Elizabethkingia anophelis]
MNPIYKEVYQHFLLSDEDIIQIAEKHQKVEIEKGKIFLHEGETANEYYLLESGLIRAFVYDYDNNEITTEFFTKGDIVIVPASLFQRTPSQENLQAVTDCTLLKIEFDDFQYIYHTIPGFSEWGRLWFSYQVFSMKQRSLDMVTLSATKRYLNLMEQKPDVVKFAPLKQIASYLGVTDTSLSRIRKELVSHKKEY